MPPGPLTPPALSAPAGGATPTTQDIARQSRAGQIDTLYRQSPGNLLATLVAAATACALVQDHVPPVRSWGWLATVVLLTAARFLLLHHYRVRASDSDVEHWAIAYAGASAVSGLLWGAAPHLLIPAETPALHDLVFILVAAVMASASMSMPVYLPAYVAFILPMGLLVTLKLLSAPSILHDGYWPMPELAGLLLAWMGATYYFARTANASYLRALRLDPESHALDRARAGGVTEVEQRNAALSAQHALHAGRRRI